MWELKDNCIMPFGVIFFLFEHQDICDNCQVCMHTPLWSNAVCAIYSLVTEDNMASLNKWPDAANYKAPRDCVVIFNNLDFVVSTDIDVMQTTL